MALVGGTGFLQPRARRILELLGSGATLEEVVVGLRLRDFQVLALLREARATGLVDEQLGVYRLTVRGAAALRRSGAVAPEVQGSE